MNNLKPALLFISVIVYSFFFIAKATTLLIATINTPVFPDTVIKYSVINRTSITLQQRGGKRLSWLKKVLFELIQMKLRKKASDEENPISKSTKTLSTISLIAGGLTILMLIAGLGVGVLALALTSIITGMIAISGNRNKRNKYKTMAILGILMGGLIIIVGLIAVIAFVAFWGN